MTKFTLALPLLAMMLLFQNAKAQTSEKVYYRIMSAKQAFADCCIEDNTANNNGTNDFLIKTWSMDNKRQQWELIPNADTTAYYIRNNYSRRYIGQTSSLVANTYYYTQNGTTQAAAWKITNLSNNQVVLSTTDDYGVTRFLNAADIKANPEKIHFLSTALHTGFAWHIIDATKDPTAIQSIQQEEELKVSTLNRQIIVSGTEDYTIFDMTGRSVPKAYSLTPGIYIVSANGQTFKVIIK